MNTIRVNKRKEEVDLKTGDIVQWDHGEDNDICIIARNDLIYLDNGNHASEFRNKNIVNICKEEIKNGKMRKLNIGEVVEITQGE